MAKAGRPGARETLPRARHRYTAAEARVSPRLAGENPRPGNVRRGYTIYLYHGLLKATFGRATIGIHASRWLAGRFHSLLGGLAGMVVFLFTTARVSLPIYWTRDERRLAVALAFQKTV